MSEFEAEMAQYEDEWAAANKDDVLADGTYQATLEICRVEHKDWGWIWAMLWRDVDSGVSVWSNLNLDNEVGREIAAKTAFRLGYEGPLGGLESACVDGKFESVTAEIYVKTKAGDTRDFTSVYVNKRLDSEPIASRAAGNDTDDIPFHHLDCWEEYPRGCAYRQTS